MEEKEVIKIIYELYDKYSVDRKFIDEISDEKRIKGVKGLLANLDINKKNRYSEEDLKIIQEIYNKYC